MRLWRAAWEGLWVISVQSLHAPSKNLNDSHAPNLTNTYAIAVDKLIWRVSYDHMLQTLARSHVLDYKTVEPVELCITQRYK